MPNGHDKNYVRLLSTCAAHYSRFGEWPTYVSLCPMILAALVVLLGNSQFVRLGERLRFKTRKKVGLGVGSARGFTEYGSMDGSDSDGELAERWLAVRPLPEFGHE